jgi:hypothetical protein
MRSDLQTRNTDGSALMMLLLLLLPLAMVLGGFAMAMQGRDNRLNDEFARERCFWAAEAGIDDAIHKAGAALLPIGAPMNGNLGEGLTYVVTATDLGTDGVDNDGDGTPDEADEDMLEVHSVGRYRSIEREVVVWLGRTSFLPPLNGAVTISSPSTDIRLTGTPRIDGNNYNLNGAPGDPALSQVGVSIMTPGTTGQLQSHLSGNEGSLILGRGGPPSLGTGPSINVLELADQARNAANMVLTNGTYSSFSFGNAPAGIGYVTYRDGDVHFAGNTRGAGILVVTGDLRVTGNFRFDGVVIVLGSFECGGGTADIYGAMVMGPAAGLVRNSGTFRLRYSDEAIRFANRASGRYVAFNGWQELAH